MSNQTDIDLMLARWLDQHAEAPLPDGLLDRVRATTAATRRRPAWQIGDLWLDAMGRVGLTQARHVLALALLAVLVALAVGSVLIIAGSNRSLPPPFGLARPGLIVFDEGDVAGLTGQVFTTDLLDGTRRAISQPGTVARSPRFSPDGNRLAFWSGETSTGPWHLTIEAADGGGSHVVGGSWAVVGNIAWAPDSVHLAWDATTGFAQRIYTARADQREANPIGDPALNASDPVWSPDGRRIAFRGVEVGAGFAGIGLYVMAVDGTGARRLNGRVAMTDYDFEAPAWSPNGNEIAVSASDGSSFNILVVEANASGEHLIADSAADELDPRWSPDGSRIAFLRGQASGLDAHHRPDLRNGGLTVVVTLPDGTAAMAFDTPQVDAQAPAWSPDGRRILGLLPIVDGTFDNRDDRLVAFDLVGGSPTIIPLGGVTTGNADWQRLGP